MNRKQVHFDSPEADIVEIKSLKSVCKGNRDRSQPEEDEDEREEIEAKAYQLVLLTRTQASANRPMQLNIDDALERAMLLERSIETDCKRHFQLKVRREDLALAWVHIRSKECKQQPKQGKRDRRPASTAQEGEAQGAHASELNDVAQARKSAQAWDDTAGDPEPAGEGRRGSASTKVTNPMRALKHLFSRMKSVSTPRSSSLRVHAEESPLDSDRSHRRSRSWLTLKRSRVQSGFDSTSPVLQ
eukprot:TRINITY_DN42894_c0_g1_i1.p1 TRINITY_DN42894_c0_g1~~TRINITY_DN42894_c0_g1_i1.p1  ORF type:complete len:244 (-),score=43.95 TRINITY_DN42894_c0_g1_i1:16-747(-)